MNSYRIFLTKSEKCAFALKRAYNVGDILNIVNGESNKIISVSVGFVGNEKEIPSIYYENNYFHCTIEYTKSKNEQQSYEVIIC